MGLPPLDMTLSTEDEFRLQSLKLTVKQLNREDLEQMFIDVTNQMLIYKKLFTQQIYK